MKKYIGFKMVEAIEADRHKETKNIYRYDEPAPDMADDEYDKGYRVVYPDGYVSWSPKDVFEKAYMVVGDNNTITQNNVDDFIANYHIQQWEDKTTVVHATLVNGFIITESSSCVDPANFSMDIGAEICIERIKNKVWELLGFLLQTAKTGI